MSKRKLAKKTSHSAGDHKNIILDDPNAKVKEVMTPVIVRRNMAFEAMFKWDGTHQLTVKSPTTLDKYAAVKFTRTLLDRMRIADIERQKEKPTMDEDEYNIYLGVYRNMNSYLKQMEEGYVAKILNEQIKAPEPMLAIVAPNSKDEDKK